MARQCLWASQWGRCRGRPGWAGPVPLAKRSPVDVDEAAVHAQASRRRSGKGCSAGTPPSRPCDRPRDRLHDRPWAQVLRRPRGSCSGRVRLLRREGDAWGAGTARSGWAALCPRRRGQGGHTEACAGFGSWCEWHRAQPVPHLGTPLWDDITPAAQPWTRGSPADDSAERSGLAHPPGAGRKGSR